MDMLDDDPNDGKADIDTTKKTVQRQRVVFPLTLSPEFNPSTRKPEPEFIKRHKLAGTAPQDRRLGIEMEFMVRPVSKKKPSPNPPQNIDYDEWVCNLESSLNRLEQRQTKFDAFRGFSFFLFFFFVYVSLVSIQLNVETAFYIEEGLRSNLIALNTGGEILPDGTVLPDISYDSISSAPDLWYARVHDDTIYD
eukprot:SAG31_NODE_2620_length_5364_cov_27.556315_3_plen_194_part_00